MLKPMIGAILLSVGTGAMAQNIAPPVSYRDLASLPVPVVQEDITDRPYRVIKHLDAEIRKATIFSKAVSREKVFRELWERGRKVGADAVIKAGYGESRITGLSWGARPVSGVAIKFLTDAEIAALPTATPAAPAGAAPPVMGDVTSTVSPPVATAMPTEVASTPQPNPN